MLEWEERLVDYLWREWSIYAHSASIGLSVEHSNTPLQYETFETFCRSCRPRAPLESISYIVSVYILLSSLVKPVNLRLILSFWRRGKSGRVLWIYCMPDSLILARP